MLEFPEGLEEVTLILGIGVAGGAGAFPFPLSSFRTGISGEGRGLMDAECGTANPSASVPGETGRPSRTAIVADLFVTSREDRREGEAGMGARLKPGGALNLKLDFFPIFPKASVVCRDKYLVTLIEGSRWNLAPAGDGKRGAGVRLTVTNGGLGASTSNIGGKVIRSSRPLPLVRREFATSN